MANSDKLEKSTRLECLKLAINMRQVGNRPDDIVGIAKKFTTYVSGEAQQMPLPRGRRKKRADKV